MRIILYGAWPLLMLGLACGDSAAGEGSVDVRISGEELVQTGWPAMDGDELLAFDDGWAVRFEHVVVSVGTLRLAARGKEVFSSDPDGYLVDLRAGDADLWSLSGVEAQRWSGVGYRLVKPDAGAEVLGDIPSEIVAAMRDEGYSLWVEGTGEKGEKLIRFRFAIPAEVTMSNCHNGRDDTDGIIVGDGRTTEVELTLHFDHLFWDDHAAEEPRLLFGPIAYAASSEGLVTLDDLKKQRLSDMKNELGEPLVDENGASIGYVPRVELPDNDLREYMLDSAMTIGHFNGEGHCEYLVTR